MSRPTAVEPAPPRRWSLNRLLLGRGPLLASLALLGAVLYGSRTVWHAARPALAADTAYRVDADAVTITPPPAWIGPGVAFEALSAAAATGPPLSLLAPPGELESRLAAALTTHPGVRRVVRVRRNPPGRVLVDVEYRTPLAAARLGRRLTPIDGDAALLPPASVSEAELARLPRLQLGDLLRGGAQAPPLGAPWTDARVLGAVAIVRQFGPDWSALHLEDVTPTHRGSGDEPVGYLLRTRGRTRIAWGPAPGYEPPGTPGFDAKLRLLRAYVTQNGPLDSFVGTPGRIDVRDGRRARVSPRVAQRDDAGATQAEPIKQASPPRDVR